MIFPFQHMILQILFSNYRIFQDYKPMLAEKLQEIHFACSTILLFQTILRIVSAEIKSSFLNTWLAGPFKLLLPSLYAVYKGCESSAFPVIHHVGWSWQDWRASALYILLDWQLLWRFHWEDTLDRPRAGRVPLLLKIYVRGYFITCTSVCQTYAVPT